MGCAQVVYPSSIYSVNLRRRGGIVGLIASIPVPRVDRNNKERKLQIDPGVNV